MDDEINWDLGLLSLTLDDMMNQSWEMNPNWEKYLNLQIYMEPLQPPSSVVDDKSKDCEKHWYMRDQKVIVGEGGEMWCQTWKEDLMLG